MIAPACPSQTASVHPAGTPEPKNSSFNDGFRLTAPSPSAIIIVFASTVPAAKSAAIISLAQGPDGIVKLRVPGDTGSLVLLLAASAELTLK